VLLQEDREIAGSGALYDQALTNGMAAIVTYEWPGREVGGRRRAAIKSARELLRVVKGQVPGQKGTHRLTGNHDGHTYEVGIRARVLEEGLSRTQPVRHARARGNGALQDAHVEALVALDEHPVLRRLEDARFNVEWRNEHRADWESIERAHLYLNVLSEDEVERRRQPDYVASYLPWDPKELLDSDEPQVCPACDGETLIVTMVDQFGEGIGAGTCVVCGYTRSEFMAYDIGMTEHINRLVREED
jgi:hypothetical protein